MRGGLRREPTDAVEQARELHAIECEQRLARIQNGVEPTHQNTHHEVRLETHVITDPLVDKRGWRWVSSSGRKSPNFRSKDRADEWRQMHPKWD